jgi:hypothetical protein
LNNTFRSEVLSIDSLRGGGSDALEDFSGSGLVLDSFFEEIGETSDSIDFLGSIKLFDYSNN